MIQFILTIILLGVIGISSQALSQENDDKDYLISIVKQVRGSFSGESRCQMAEYVPKYLIAWFASSTEESIKSGCQFDDEINIFVERKSVDALDLVCP